MRGHYDREAQKKHTLHLNSPMLEHCRGGMPGFRDMEETLCALLQRLTREEYVLDFAHGLRQGPGPEYASLAGAERTFPLRIICTLPSPSMTK